jgi:hypothetical protein
LPSNTWADVATIERQRVVRARRGVLKLAGEEQHVPGFQLRGDVLRQQIGRPNVLAPRALPVSIDDEGLGQLEARLTEARVLLERVAILDDGFLDLLLTQKSVAALNVLTLCDFRVARAGDAHCGDQQDGQQGAALQCGTHLVLLTSSYTSIVSDGTTPE